MSRRQQNNYTLHFRGELDIHEHEQQHLSDVLFCVVVSPEDPTGLG